MIRRFVGADVVIDGTAQRLDVMVRDGRIVELLAAGTSPARNDDVDFAGSLIAPGFIDLQCNGAGGFDITTDPGQIPDVSRALPRFGVTSYLPTVVTAPPATRQRALAAMAELRGRPHSATDGATALGLHFEGPAISMDHLGAHVGRFAGTPTDDELDAWVESGCVSLVTLAPETDGGVAMVERLAGGGIVVSAGHTAMTPNDFRRGCEVGVRYVTHLFNAMAPFSHRAPGPIGATLADGETIVGIICDGIHVDPVAVAMAWNALGAERLSLVSDASAALGRPFGTFMLGNFEVTSDETGVRTASGVLAGSSLQLDQAVRNLVAFTGCDLIDAVATVTSTPADLLGLDDRGRIAVGNHADLTVLDPSGELVATVIAGDVVWEA